MDIETLVDEQKDGGKQLLEHLTKNGFAVAVGFWALTTVDERWFLYIASPDVDTRGLAAAYRFVNTALGRSGIHWVQHSDVRLISNNDPIAAEAIFYGSTHGKTNFGGRKLGSLIIEKAYIYPIPSVTADAVVE